MSSGLKAQYTYFFHKLNYTNTLELNAENTEKFRKYSTLFCKHSILCVTLGLYGGYLGLTHFMVLMHLSSPQDQDTSISLTIFWWLWSIISMRTGAALILTSLYYIFIVSLYLTLRLKEVLKNFNISIKQGK